MILELEMKKEKKDSFGSRSLHVVSLPFVHGGGHVKLKSNQSKKDFYLVHMIRKDSKVHSK